MQSNLWLIDVLALHFGSLVIHAKICQVGDDEARTFFMFRDNQVEDPGLTVLHWLKDHRKVLLRCRIFTQPCDALQRSPSNQDSILHIFLQRLEDEDGARRHSQIAKLVLLAILINLLLTGKNLHVYGFVYKVAEIVDLAQVESANLVQIILNKIHLLDEFRDELDE